MIKKRRLPLGIQSFSKMREGNYVYVDKTERIYDFVYCFEFKLDGTAAEALIQIDTKKYLLPWSRSGEKLFKVGVDFDKEKCNIGEYVFVGE
jgi:hypothetical protein